MKKLRLIFISSLILLIVFNVSQESQSCGGDYWYVDYPTEYGLYSPIPEKTLKYAGLGLVYNYRPYGRFYLTPTERNLEEWQKYFDNKVATQAIYEAMYPTQSEDIFQILQFINQKSHQLSARLQKNALVQYCRNNPSKTKEFLDYLVYTKFCEPSALHGNYRWFDADNVKMQMVEYQPTTNNQQEGELVREIAEKLNVKVENLVKEYKNIPRRYFYNKKLSKPMKVSVAEISYTTTKEETLYEIKNKFGVHFSFGKHLEFVNNWTAKDLEKITIQKEKVSNKNYFLLPIENYFQEGMVLDIRKSANEIEDGSKVMIDEYIEKNKNGSSLSHIAWDYNIDEKELRKWNNLDAYTQEYGSVFTSYGQKLTIKTKSYKHRVKFGENLQNIAQKYDIPAYHLGRIIRKWNAKPTKIIKAYEDNFPRRKGLFLGSLFKKGVTMKIYLDPSFVSGQSLIAKGVEEAKKAKSDFMRARYAYQAIRLAKYSKQNKKAVKLYEELIEPIQDKSMICYWALEKKAGALRSLGKQTLSNYTFAQVFFNEPSRAKTAFHSFEVKSDREWEELVKLCKNKEEKTSLFLLRALSWEADILTELQNIYAIDPHSKHLKLLLVKLINTLEHDLLGAALENENILFVEDYRGFPKEASYETLQALNKWLEKVMAESKFQHKDFWRLSNAYIQYLNQKPKKAKQYFQDLAKNSRNIKIAQQAKVFALMLEISELKEITPEIEQQIFTKVQSFKSSERKNQTYRVRKTPEEYLYHKLSSFMTQVFALHYDKTKDIGKIALCNPKFTTYEEKLVPSLNKTEGIIRLLEKENKTSFEKFLLQKIDTNITQQQVFLYEMKGTILLQQNKVQKALEAFKKVPNPEENLRQAAYNPLSEKQFQETNETWNKKIIAEKILSLEKLIQKENKKSIQVLITLGNIYYNLSHSGNMWWTTDYYWSSRAKATKTYQIWVGYEYVDTQDNTDLSNAKNYYQRAFALSKKYNQDNLASKALFLLAKCENQITQPSFYAYESKEEYLNAIKEYEQILIQYETYITELQNSYKHTAYYQNVIKECGMID